MGLWPGPGPGPGPGLRLGSRLGSRLELPVCCAGPLSHAPQRCRPLAVIHSSAQPPSCGFCQIASFGVGPKASFVHLPTPLLPHLPFHSLSARQKKENTWQKFTDRNEITAFPSSKGVQWHPSSEARTQHRAGRVWEPPRLQRIWGILTRIARASRCG